MAWRPTRYLIEGELDNTVPGKVTGWMLFAGIRGKVFFDLVGNFHRDIQGAKIRFRGNTWPLQANAGACMRGFSRQQTGKAGDMTAGLPPGDYVIGRCYLEWYSRENGRVVIELDQRQVEVIGKPLPLSKAVPISRQEQAQNLADFLEELPQHFHFPGR